MALTQRERNIAIGVGGAIGFYLLFSFAIDPYIQKRSAMASEVEKQQKDLSDADDLARNRVAKEPVWEYIKTSGLDNALADSRLGRMIETWASDDRRRPPGASFRITGGNQSRGSAGNNSPITANGFMELKVQVQATGNQKGLAWILWNLERVSVPVKVNEVSVKPRVEGRDELNITLNLSTLALAQPGGRTP